MLRERAIEERRVGVGHAIATLPLSRAARTLSADSGSMPKSLFTAPGWNWCGTLNGWRSPVRPPWRRLRPLWLLAPARA